MGSIRTRMAYKRTIAILSIFLVFSFALNVILAIGLFSKVQNVPKEAEPSPTPVNYSDIEPEITIKPTPLPTIEPTFGGSIWDIEEPQLSPEIQEPEPTPTPTPKPTKKPQRRQTPTPAPVETQAPSGGLFGGGEKVPFDTPNGNG